MFAPTYKLEFFLDEWDGAVRALTIDSAALGLAYHRVAIGVQCAVWNTIVHSRDAIESQACLQSIQ
jgi:hypothetical protein